MEAKRLGCLYIPELRIQVHRRDEGLSPSIPLILLTRQGRRQIVAAASADAEREGVRTGMSIAQAEVACPRALVRDEDPGRYNAAGQDILARLLALAPVVEGVRLGLYYIGMKGLRWLYEDEAAMLRSVIETVQSAGLVATAGAAGTRFTALIAATTAQSGKVKQVHSGDERHFLAPLPLSLLPATQDLLERLLLLGITTLGELAALAPRSVERRYGTAGVKLYRLARADDDAHLHPTWLPAAYQKSALLEAPADNAEGLLFVLAPLIEELLHELEHQGRACAALLLQCRLEGGGTLDVPVLLGSPVTVAKPLVDLLRLKLSKVRLEAGVVEVRIEATRVTEPSTPQGDLFRRVGSPSGMAVTLARLTEALGPDAVVTCELTDGYRPDQTFTLKPVQAGAPGLLEAASGVMRRPKPQRGARASTAPPTKGAASGLNGSADTRLGSGMGAGNGARAGNGNGMGAGSGMGAGNGARAGNGMGAGSGNGNGNGNGNGAQAPSPLPGKIHPGFRKMPTPRELIVQVDEDGPISLLTRGRTRRIEHRQGPFRYGGGWWEADFDRAYYQIILKEGIELLIFQDLHDQHWYLEGIFD